MRKGFSISIMMVKSISVGEAIKRSFFVLYLGRLAVLKTSSYKEQTKFIGYSPYARPCAKALVWIIIFNIM